MAEFVSVEGVVESLGNAEVQKDGTLYSVVKFRLDDGKVRSLTDVMFPKRTHLEVVAGERLAVVGFMLEGKVVVFAVARDGEVVDDVAFVAQAKRALQNMGAVFLLLCLVMCWTVVVPFVLLFPALRVRRNASGMPDEAEMRREMAARLSAP